MYDHLSNIYVMECKEDPTLEQHFVGHSAPITCLCFSPSGKQLVSSSEDKTFMNWNLSSSKSSLRYRAKTFPFNHVTFSPSGNLIASAQSQYVRLWMASVQGKSLEFKAHTSTIRSVRFSSDGKTFLTASDDKSLKIWRTYKRKFVSSLIGHTNWVKFGNFSSDGSQIVSCSDDKTIRIWDNRTSQQIHTFNEIKDVPFHVDFHPTKTYVGAAVGNSIKIYDMRSLRLIQYYPCHQRTVNSFSFHPNGKFILTGSEDKTSKIIDLIEGRPIISLEGHTQGVTTVAFSPSGTHFATGSKDTNVYIWKTNLDFCNEIQEKSAKNIHFSRSASDVSTNTEEEKSENLNQYENIFRSKFIHQNCTHIEFENINNQDVNTVFMAQCIQNVPNLKETMAGPMQKASFENLFTSVNTLNSRINELEQKISILEVRKISERKTREHSY